MMKGTTLLKVSIITATYNRASTIIRALESIKNQNYYNIQIIVIDGASSDNTISLVQKQLGDGDILISEPDDGIYDALNKGLDKATGEIIAFLHSDDFYFNDEVISRVVDQFYDEDTDVVYGDVSFFSEFAIDKTKRVYRSDNLSEKNLAWGKMPAHPAMFVRRRVYDSIGRFKTDFEIAADYEFLCRMVKIPNLKTFYLPSILVRMQIGGVSTSSFRNTVKLNKEVLRALQHNGIYSNLFMIMSKYFSKSLQFLKS